MSNTPRYWVIGGEYTSMGFERLVEGTQKVSGPYFHLSAAQAVWRRLSEADRYRTLVRYTIVTEGARKAA